VNAPARWLVFYDGLCPVCNRSRRLLTRLDWRNRLEFVDIHERARCQAELPQVSYADMLRQMYVKRPDGRAFGGFDALRALAPALPPLWPAWPLMWLPGAAAIGRRVYRRIARNRFRKAACDSEVCELHVKLLAGREMDDQLVAEFLKLSNLIPLAGEVPADDAKESTTSARST
jgi:predicted DCC family thiol-disulfide oxidoreductase YuxK